MNKPKAKRPLEDLNLIDSYLFSASTERIQDAEVIARIIVERATGQTLSKVIVETEKQLKGIETDHRGIRLDLFISEFDNERIARVYDIEPNNYDLSELPKRDRYNQALSDVKLLETNADFRQLPEFVSISVMRLFLNAKGSIGGNQRLVLDLVWKLIKRWIYL